MIAVCCYVVLLLAYRCRKSSSSSRSLEQSREILLTVMSHDVEVVRSRAYHATYNIVKVDCLAFFSAGMYTLCVHLVCTPCVYTLCVHLVCTPCAQCRINYGSGGSPEPGPLNSGGLIISQKNFCTYKIYQKLKNQKLRQFTYQYTHFDICILKII